MMTTEIMQTVQFLKKSKEKVEVNEEAVKELMKRNLRICRPRKVITVAHKILPTDWQILFFEFYSEYNRCCLQFLIQPLDKHSKQTTFSLAFGLAALLNDGLYNSDKLLLFRFWSSRRKGYRRVAARIASVLNYGFPYNSGAQ